MTSNGLEVVEIDYDSIDEEAQYAAEYRREVVEPFLREQRDEAEWCAREMAK